jgi:hypothetical protein
MENVNVIKIVHVELVVNVAPNLWHILHVNVDPLANVEQIVSVEIVASVALNIKNNHCKPKKQFKVHY